MEEKTVQRLLLSPATLTRLSLLYTISIFMCPRTTTPDHTPEDLNLCVRFALGLPGKVYV